MIIGAAGNDAITVLSETGGQRLCVDHDLSLVFAELRLNCFVEANRFCSDDVHERAALYSGKNCGVNLLREFFLAHHNAAAWAAQAFMRRGGDKLRVLNR